MFELSIDRIVQLLAIVVLFVFVLTLGSGWLQIRSARRLPFFMLRRRRVGQGWRLILFGILIGIVALFILIFGRQVAYTIVPPTPSLTPTITITPPPDRSRTGPRGWSKKSRESQQWIPTMERYARVAGGLEGGTCRGSSLYSRRVRRLHWVNLTHD